VSLAHEIAARIRLEIFSEKANACLKAQSCAP